jgi:hypothetical protein
VQAGDQAAKQGNLCQAAPGYLRRRSRHPTAQPVCCCSLLLMLCMCAARGAVARAGPQQVVTLHHTVDEMPLEVVVQVSRQLAVSELGLMLIRLVQL